jgi:hypothetical protein
VSGKEEARRVSGQKNLMSFRFLLIAVLISITMGGFFVACSSDDDTEGLEVNSNEKSLNLRAPNGEKIADNILQLKKIVSVSVGERFGIDKDFDITSLEYVPIEDGYVVLIKYRTFDDIEGGILRTNSLSILEADGIISSKVRLKSGGENESTINGVTYTCTPNPSTSLCNCIPTYNIGMILPICAKKYPCTGSCILTY